MFATQYTRKLNQEFITILDTQETFTVLYGQWVSMQTWKPIEYSETRALLDHHLQRYRIVRKMFQ